MNTSISLLVAFGIASQPVLAQTQTSPQMTQGSESQSSSGVQPPPASSPSAPGMQTEPQPGASPPSTSGASGAPSESQSGAAQDATSGASGAPSESQSGTSQDATSGASGPMQSEAGMELRPPPTPMQSLKPQTQDDVTFLCGGVGEDEAAFMKKQVKDYDLMLTFATRKGAYLADVAVDITDAKGNQVLQTSCDGPILLVDLPRSGNYRVRADAAGYTLNKTVKVTAAKQKGRQIASTVLTWPQQVAEVEGEASTTSGAGSSGTGSSGNSQDNSRTESNSR